MNWIKKISKIFISLLVIVNSTISFDYEPAYERLIEINRTELLISKEDVSPAAEYDFFKKLLFLNSIKQGISISDKLTHSRDLSNNSLLEYKIQNKNLLKYKSILLKVFLNDIIQQKSHWV